MGAADQAPPPPNFDPINLVTIAPTAKVEAGVNANTTVRIEPLGSPAPLERQLPLNRLGTLLTAFEKSQQVPPLPVDTPYEYASLSTTEIRFDMVQGHVIQLVSGFGTGIGGRHYKFLPSTASILPQSENYFNTARWSELDAAEVAALPTSKNINVYQSNVTANAAVALANKFYVIKPVELPRVTLVYKNIGNLLLQQREAIIQLKISHAGDSEPSLAGGTGQACAPAW